MTTLTNQNVTDNSRLEKEDELHKTITGLPSELQLLNPPKKQVSRLWEIIRLKVSKLLNLF